MHKLLESFLAHPYGGYLYSYPHKSAYRPFTPRPLHRVWQEESKESLFLYVHLPFCKTKCRFCNLLSRTGADRELLDRYAACLLQEARTVQEELGTGRISGFALGGGSPNMLDPGLLTRLVTGLEKVFGFAAGDFDTSLEIAPRDISPGVLEQYGQLGIKRLSVGIQSFAPEELALLGRKESPEQLGFVLETIKAHAVAFCLNIDLIYGIPGQSEESFLDSLDKALSYAPDQLFLYPLYVRPGTGLEQDSTGGHKLRLYRAGRDRLLGAGYLQDSMRKFIRPGPDLRVQRGYFCQEEGMIGLGCGARSYTKNLHYSPGYALAQPAVRELINHYLSADYRLVHHGFLLDEDEQRRRYIIKSLLKARGLDQAAFTSRFGLPPLEALPCLALLEEAGLALQTAGQLQLTPKGLELSDAVGPFLVSPAVRTLMEEYTLP